MVTQIRITNYNALPVIFRGSGFLINIPGNIVGLLAQIPVDNAVSNIQNVQFEHPHLQIEPLGVEEGIPTNDTVYVAPTYLDDQNYQGAWDASAGSDPHESPEEGWYWRVTVPGSHPLDGITQWVLDDHVKWNGTRWLKIVTGVIRSHDSLINVRGGAPGQYYHFTEEQYESLLPTGDPTFHYVTAEHITVNDIEVGSINIAEGTLGRTLDISPVDVTEGENPIDVFPAAIAKSAVWFYTIDNESGMNMRSGRIQAAWRQGEDSSIAPSADESTPDIGDTSAVSFSVAKESTNVVLKCNVEGVGTWTVDLVRMLIGEGS